MLSHHRGIPKNSFVGCGPLRTPASDIWSLLLQVVHVARPVRRDWPSLRDSTVPSLGSPDHQRVTAGLNPNVSPSKSPVHRCRLQPGRDPWVGPISESVHIPCWLESVCSGILGPGGPVSPASFSLFLSPRYSESFLTGPGAEHVTGKQGLI